MTLQDNGINWFMTIPTLANWPELVGQSCELAAEVIERLNRVFFEKVQLDALMMPALRWPVWLTSIMRPCSSIAMWKRSSPWMRCMEMW